MIEPLLLLTFTISLIALTLLVIIFVKIQKTSSDNQYTTVKDMFNEKFIDLIQENRNQTRLLQDAIGGFLDTLGKNTKISLESISEKVDKRLEQGFEKTHETFGKIIERMAKIDQAQKNIEKLSEEVVGLHYILGDSKQRGLFGEVQLETIIANIFGKNNYKIFVMQYHFKEKNVLADCVIKTPQGLIVIDAKFPLRSRENTQTIKKYSRDDENNENTANNTIPNNNDQKKAKDQFIIQIKKLIDDVAEKYINPPITLPNAFVFIPSEAIFADLHVYYPDLIVYAQQKRVNMTSPTTLTAMLTIVLSVIHNHKTQEQASIIQEEMTKLHKEFTRFGTRREKFSKDFKNVGKDIDDIAITSSKIIDKFERIESVELVHNNDEDTQSINNK